jgi:hypothetical protein
MDHGSLLQLSLSRLDDVSTRGWAAGLIFSGPAPDSPEINLRRSGPSCCHAGRSIASMLMVFVQSTLCSIGLFQTALQLVREYVDSSALSGRG